MASKWEDLAYILQFSSAMVNTIKRDTKDCTAACTAVLDQWLGGPEETRHPVNWATLIECLRDCEFNTLARDLENALL